MVQTLDLSAEPQTRKRPREFGPAHAIWFVPALAIAALLSIPVGLALSAIVKRRERSFKNRMKERLSGGTHVRLKCHWQKYMSNPFG